MKSKILKLSMILTALIAVFTPVSAAYFHGDDFFPVGLTGIGYTGHGTPYGKEWRGNGLTEMKLIDELGINCIGCEDAWQKILIDFAQNRDSNTYIEEVLPYLASARADTGCYDTVYLITASYGAAPKRFDKNIIFKYTEANL